MRRNSMLVLSIFAIAIFSQPWSGVWRSTAGERSTTADTPATRVALLDLGRIFTVHVNFKKNSEVLRGEVEQAERALVTRKAELQAAANALGDLPKGSGEAKQLEEQIARDTSEVQLLVAKQKRDFFEQEAAMYYETYQEVMKAVSTYSQQRGINLVMRFNGDPYDPEDPQALQKELNKAVVYHDGIDITDDIIRIVNAKVEE
jgi:Skp family chaperone for outer membrane proteins